MACDLGPEGVLIWRLCNQVREDTVTTAALQNKTAGAEELCKMLSGSSARTDAY